MLMSILRIKVLVLQDISYLKPQITRTSDKGVLKTSHFKVSKSLPESNELVPEGDERVRSARRATLLL